MKLTLAIVACSLVLFAACAREKPTVTRPSQSKAGTGLLHQLRSSVSQLHSSMEAESTLPHSDIEATLDMVEQPGLLLASWRSRPETIKLTLVNNATYRGN